VLGVVNGGRFPRHVKRCDVTCMAFEGYTKGNGFKTESRHSYSINERRILVPHTPVSEVSRLSNNPTSRDGQISDTRFSLCPNGKLKVDNNEWRFLCPDETPFEHMRSSSLIHGSNVYR